MPKKTRKESMKTRDRLLEAALDVFSEKSFSDVTLSEVAERVGLTKGALYWHFENKNDLFMKLIEEICLDSEREFAEKYGEPLTIIDLKNYYKKKLLLLDKDERFMKIYAIMLRRFEWPEEVRANIFLIMRGMIKKEKIMIENILFKSRQDGIIRQDIDVEDVAEAIASVFHGLFILVVNEIVTDDISKCTDFICNAFGKELLYNEN